MSLTETSSDQTAVLSCYGCKRRKIKCDRSLPVCAPCHKASRECEFPSHQKKPGPKPGASHKDANVSRSSASVTSSVSRPLQYQIPMPSVSDRRTVEAAANDPAAVAFSEFTYPSHDGQTRPATPATRTENVAVQSRYSRILDQVCSRLQINRNHCTHLLELYFSNMTAFSLFTKQIVEAKLASTPSLLDAEALLAAVFSFSARFQTSTSASYTVDGTEDRSSSYFAAIASKKVSQGLDECGDSTASLCLLQAYILLTFYELTRAVRSRAWRALGQCIRIAYELKLHLVDQDFKCDAKLTAKGGDVDVEEWTRREEKRRAWWAIWEMDVFASTIRRLPTAIDWAQNSTLLPVSDLAWHKKKPETSCFLHLDPTLRWKSLAESQNRSAKAWFILVNSLMRNTQVIVYSPGATQATYTAEDREVDLLSLSNALYCAVSSLPEELAYHGELLTFRTSDGATEQDMQLQRQSDKYSLHLMTQLSHFMINHHQIRAQAPWFHGNTESANFQPVEIYHKTSNAEWSNYMNAADEIVAVVRNSATHHYRHVNPFLTNTLWFAAAAQCSCRVFGPPSLSRQRRLADSNLELLRLTIDRFIGFWGSTESLKDKLARMESGLKSLMEQRRSMNNVDDRGRPEEAAPTTDGTMADIMPNENMDSSTGLNDFVSTLAPDNNLFAFDDPLDQFPYGLDDLLIPYNSSLLNIDL